MAHGTHDIWALYTSFVIWWSVVITVFRHGNKAQRILFARILVHSVRTTGHRYNSFQNSIFCPTISNICPVLIHSRLTRFSRTLSSFSVLLYVHLMLRFPCTAPDKCKSEPTVEAKNAFPWKHKKVECVLWGHLNPCSGDDWKIRDF